MSVLFVGDTSFGEYYQRISSLKGRGSVLARMGYDYPMENFRKILGDSFFVFANMESPVTSISISPYMGRKKYINADKPGIAPVVLKKHNFGAVSLANNHSGDFGHAGLEDTARNLSMNGIDTFGAGKDIENAARPYILSVPVSDSEIMLCVVPGLEYRDRYKNEYRYYAGESYPGVALLSPVLTGNLIRSIRKRYPRVLLVVYPHWGVNYSWRNRSQRRTAESLIRAGADLIIGHGAHHFQEIENISGKWVVYNTGNFMFNSPGRYRETGAHPYSLIAGLKISHDKNGYSAVLRLYPIHTDNMKNRYRGRFLSEKEFAAASAMLMDKSGFNGNITHVPERGRDKYGPYLELRVR